MNYINTRTKLKNLPALEEYRKGVRMLSKEEFTPIELREHCIKTMQFSDRNSNAYKEHELILSIMDENISMKYEIDQLESDKQKLIEKLEKRRKQNNDKYGRAIDTDEFPEMYEYSGQVEEDDYLLSIVKGVENESTNKS